MSFEELKRALAAEAQAKGICSEWYSFILRATSKERLLTLFVKGLDFVFDNDFPSAELRAEFKGLHEHYGVFIDEPFSVADMRRIVAFGTSEGKARFSGFCAAQVWARDLLARYRAVSAGLFRPYPGEIYDDLSQGLQCPVLEAGELNHQARCAGEL